MKSRVDDLSKTSIFFFSPPRAKIHVPCCFFIASAIATSVLSPIAISFVILADPIGKTAKCINSPSKIVFDKSAYANSASR